MERELVSPFHVDGYQQKTSPTQEKNENTNQGFVQLVLGPILKCMGLFGFPVPDDCPHVKTGSTADTSTCSSCSSVQNQDSLRHVHTEDTLLQDLDTPPQDYKDDALISDPADATCNTTCMTSGRSDKNIVPVWTISEQDLKQDIQEKMNEDCQAVMQNKSSELKGKHAVYPVPHSVEKNAFISDGETNISVRHRHHTADVEKVSELKEQELRMRRQQCRVCHRKKTLRKIVFAFIVIMSAALIGRYTAAFFNLNSGESHLVSSIVSMVSYLGTLLMYVTSYFPLYWHLPRLLQLLRLYEGRYSVTVDCHVLRKQVIALLVGSSFAETSMLVIFGVGIHTFLPSFEDILSPFGKQEGLSVYFISGLTGLVTLLLLVPLMALGSLLVVGTYVIVKEYRYVTQQLALLIPSQEDYVLKDTQQRANNTRSESEQTVSGRPGITTIHESHKKWDGDVSSNDFKTMSDFPPHPNSTKSGISSQKTVSKISTDKQDPQLVPNSKKILNPTSTFAIQSPPEKHVQTRAQNGSKRWNSINNKKKNRKFTSNNSFPDEVIHLENIDETSHNIQGNNNGKHKTSQIHEERQLRVLTENPDRNSPGHQARNRQRGPRQLKDVEEALHRVQGRRHGKKRREEREESHLQDVEDVFDHLCGQHQMLCAILHHFQACLTHITSLAFVSGIPLFCLIIFGLGNSSLQADEAGLVGFTLVHTTMAIATPTVLGILVNDHAHGAQEVMFAADWSQFSDRLLTKVQLFASRLGHTKIGYHVYGLFVIDRSTVLMVLGTLVTYTIVVIQFQQGDVSTGHTASNTTVLS